MLVFTEPIAQRLARGAPGPSTAPSAAASIGSPTGVPVPCASTYWTLGRRRPRRRRAPSRSIASCAAALGTVIPVVRPSWLTAVPRTRRRSRSPSASARVERLQHDDAGALAAHVAVRRGVERLQRPSGESIDGLAEADRRPRASGSALHAADERQRRTRRSAARWQREVHRRQRRRAGGVDDRLGPRRSKRYEMRLAAMLQRAAGVRSARRSGRGSPGSIWMSP